MILLKVATLLFINGKKIMIFLQKEILYTEKFKYLERHTKEFIKTLKQNKILK
jgi:hypothetical protein